MTRCLVTVEETFAIQGRGLVLCPGIIPEGDERLRIGLPIVLRRPDGSCLETRIDSLELYSPNVRGDVLILLKDLAKSDVPAGTEVWSSGW